VGLLVAGLVIEAALVWIARGSPAFRVIMRPVYAVVAALFGLAIWNAARRREERRHGDRRRATHRD
jgi:hypothetical protein